MASCILNNLAQNKLHKALPMAAHTASRAVGSTFCQTHALAAICHGKAGFIQQSLAYWDKIIRNEPYAYGWLEAGLNVGWEHESAMPEAKKYIDNWIKLFERIYIYAPPAGLMRKLYEHGWKGAGACGIHQGYLVGWAFLKKGENLKIFADVPKNAQMPMTIKPKYAIEDHILYNLRCKLPQFSNSYSITLCNSEGTPLTGSPLVCSPPSAAVANAKRKVRNHSVTVLIPVYDGYRETLACLGAVFSSQKHNKANAEIKVIWDCGPVKALLLKLRRLARRGKIQLIENNANMGFLATVNHGIASIAGGDVILLNADTITHGDWIDRMLKAASEPETATVTALGNEAELMSFPSPLCRGTVDSLRQTAILDNAAKTLPAAKAVLEIPTGVGFCMLITRKALNRIGGLDGLSLFRGYGEEVDFCLRAEEQGLKNYGAFNVFVTHLGEKSFGIGKKALAAQNNLAIHKRFPAYGKTYEKFIHDERPKALREALSLAALDSMTPVRKLEIYPWNCRELPPWQTEENKDMPENRAALFFKPSPNPRAMLRVFTNVPLTDIYFRLPEDSGLLAKAIASARFENYEYHGSTRACSILRKILPSLPEELFTENETDGLPEKFPETVIASLPLSLAALQKLRDLARAHAKTVFFVYRLSTLWPLAHFPNNVRELPAIKDFSPLRSSLFIQLDNAAKMADWQTWLAGHNLENVAIHKAACQ